MTLKNLFSTIKSLLRKYELDKTDSFQIGEHTLYRIRALRDFGDVKTGNRGGYIESESNLSQYGDCWVDVYCFVYGDVRVSGNAQIRDRVRLFGKANISGDVVICDSMP